MKFSVVCDSSNNSFEDELMERVCVDVTFDTGISKNKWRVGLKSKDKPFLEFKEYMYVNAERILKEEYTDGLPLAEQILQSKIRLDNSYSRKYKGR